MKSIEETLESLSLFKTMDTYEIATLIKYIKIIEFQPADIIIQQGRAVQGLFIIEEGKAEVSLRLPGGRETKIATLDYDHFFGDMVLLRGGTATATIKAMTHTKCIFISTEIFNAMRLWQSQIWYKIMIEITKHICHRIMIGIHLVADKLNDIPKISYKVPKAFSAQQVNLADISFGVLKTLVAFKYYNCIDIINLLSFMESINVPKNYVVAANKINDRTHYIIIQGAVEIIAEHHNHTAKLAVLGAGNIFVHNYQPVMTQENEVIIPVSYITRENTVLYKIEPNQIIALQRKHVELYYEWSLSVSCFFTLLLDSINKQLIRYQSLNPVKSKTYMKYRLES